MKRLATIGIPATIAALVFPLAAAARDFVQDGAGMFSKSAIAQADDRIGAFNRATGKDIVVVTVPTLGGEPLQDAAREAFVRQDVNGVLIFVARDDRRDIIIPDRAGAQAGWFTSGVLESIRTQMESQFRAENYDAGLAAGVDGVLAVYRSHAGASRSQVPATTGGALATTGRSLANGGKHISMFWWIIIAVVGFLVLRSIMRAFSRPRYGPGMPGPMQPGSAPPPGYGPGYGGYGPGYGGGGSFWSGLLGGLGGAWLGNEMFRGGGASGGTLPADGGQNALGDSGGSWGGADSAGWQSDAGQADMGNASSGDWSGGGFGDGGGGDSGGGGGDSGGGW